MKNRPSNLSERTDKQKQRAYLFRDFSIRTKLIILFLMVSIIPLIIIATRDTLQMQQALTKGAQISLKSSATQTANSLDNFIQNTLDTIGVEAQLAEFVNYLTMSAPARTGFDTRDRAKSLIVNLSKKESHIISYALVDTVGTIILGSATDAQTNEGKEPYFEQVQTSGSSIVTLVTYLEDNKTTSLTFASKVYDSNGTYIGVLRATYNSSVLQDVILKSVGTSTDATAILLDPLHIRMADNQSPELILKSIAPLDAIDYSFAVKTRRFLDIPAEQQATNHVDFELALDNVSEQPFFRADINPNVEGDDMIAAAFLRTQPWIITYSRPTPLLIADVQNQIPTNIILVLGTSIIIFIIIALIARSLTNPITALAKVANLIEQGDLSARAQIQSRDEIGTLAGSFNLMANQLKEMLGNLEQRVVERTAVAESARAEAESARKEIEMQIWLTSGQAQLAERMRGEQSVEMLADNVASHLSQYLGAQTGVLFLVSDNKLKLTGRYAYVERAGQKSEFAFGENLIGESAKANHIIRVDNVPVDAPPVFSALGDAVPRQLLIAPIEVEGQVVGVVEFATLDQFSAKHEAFLHRVSESIAIAFRTAQTRAQVDELLVQSQRQTEELQVQEEELRAANEELQARAENLNAAREFRG